MDEIPNPLPQLALELHWGTSLSQTRDELPSQVLDPLLQPLRPTQPSALGGT